MTNKDIKEIAEKECVKQTKPLVKRLDVLEKLIAVIAHYTGQEKPITRAGLKPMELKNIKRG